MSHTVLLLDDDSNVLDGLSRALRKEPYRIIAATTGAEALSVLQTTPVDVLLCDEQMPGLSGTEFLSQVAKAYPLVVRMMLTGHANPALWQRAISQGAIYRFLCKPCGEIELRLAIAQAIRHQTLSTSLAGAEACDR